MNFDINTLLDLIKSGKLDEVPNKDDNEDEKINERTDDDLVNKEYIRFRRIDLVNVLKMSAPIFNSKSDSFVPKSVVINYDLVEDKYKMITNNDLEYVEYEFEVLNKNNRLFDTICLPISLLKTLIKMFDEEILIYKSGNNYYIKLQFNGDLELDIPKAEQGMLKRPGTELEYQETISCSYVGESLQSIIPIARDEQSIENRRITFDKDRVIFTSSKIAIQFLVQTPKIRIGIKLAEIIRNICNVYPDDPLEVYRDKVNSDRIYFKCNNILITSTCLTEFNNSIANEYLDKNRNNKQVIVNTEDLKKLTSMTTGLPYSDGKIGFKYKDNSLAVYIKTIKKTENNFLIPIKTKLVEDKVLEAIKTPIYVSGRQLEKLLEAFSKYDDIILSMTLNSIIINKNNITGVIEK